MRSGRNIFITQPWLHRKPTDKGKPQTVGSIHKLVGKIGRDTESDDLTGTLAGPAKRPKDATPQKQGPLPEIVGRMGGGESTSLPSPNSPGRDLSDPINHILSDPIRVGAPAFDPRDPGPLRPLDIPDYLKPITAPSSIYDPQPSEQVSDGNASPERPSLPAGIKTLDDFRRWSETGATGVDVTGKPKPKPGDPTPKQWFDGIPVRDPKETPDAGEPAEAEPNTGDIPRYGDSQPIQPPAAHNIGKRSKEADEADDDLGLAKEQTFSPTGLLDKWRHHMKVKAAKLAPGSKIVKPGQVFDDHDKLPELIGNWGDLHPQTWRLLNDATDLYGAEAVAGNAKVIAALNDGDAIGLADGLWEVAGGPAARTESQDFLRLMGLTYATADAGDDLRAGGKPDELAPPQDDLPAIPEMGKNPSHQERQIWLEAVSAHARKVKNDTEHPLRVSVQLAQTILESGWGTSKSFREGNNIGGVKGRGDTGSANLPTKENIDGVEVSIRADFATYSSVDAAFASQGNLIGTAPRYEGVRTATTAEEQAKALQDAGCATDPEYAKKLISLIRQHNLEQYDE